MSTWKINSKSTQTSATYTSAPYTVQVNYTENATTDTLTSISGSIYKGEDQSYAGNFNGSRNGEDISYSFSDVKLSDMGAVVVMVEDIENIITNGGEE